MNVGEEEDEDEDKIFSIVSWLLGRRFMDLVSVRMTSPSTANFASDFLPAALEPCCPDRDATM